MQRSSQKGRSNGEIGHGSNVAAAPTDLSCKVFVNTFLRGALSKSGTLIADSEECIGLKNGFPSIRLVPIGETGVVPNTVLGGDAG